MSAHRIISDLKKAEIDSGETVALLLWKGAFPLHVISPSAPSNGVAGYAPGCLWIDTTNKNHHINKGDETSTTWQTATSS